MESYLTVEELAHTLKVEVGTVRRWLRTGKLRGLKMDRVWRIPQTELQAHLYAPVPEEAGGEPAYS